MNIICLVVDGLQAGFLNPYGNSWIRTPQLNRLAAEGLVVDQAYVDALELAAICRSLWTGRHAAARRSEQVSTLAERLSAAGFQTQLITDDREVYEHPLAGDFRQRLLLGSADDRAAGEAADDLNDTEMAILFADATAQLAEAQEPFATWIHSRGLIGSWDAPWSLREQYLQEEEPEFTVEAKLSELLNPAAQPFAIDVDDPDHLLALRMAYAAQVGLFDICLAGLLEGLADMAFAGRTAVVVVGARGFGLGQHGVIGVDEPTVHEEFAHVPWLLRLPDGLGASDRIASLAQSIDLAPTLLELAGVSVEPHPSPARGASLLPLARRDAGLAWRDRLLSTGADGGMSIRTPAWHLMREPDRDDDLLGGASRHRLYAKPDDRWEVNDVADRCPEIVDALSKALDELARGVASDEATALTPLDETLLAGLA